MFQNLERDWKATIRSRGAYECFRLWKEQGGGLGVYSGPEEIVAAVLSTENENSLLMELFRERKNFLARRILIRVCEPSWRAIAYRYSWAEDICSLTVLSGLSVLQEVQVMETDAVCLSVLSRRTREIVRNCLRRRQRQSAREISTDFSEFSSVVVSEEAPNPFWLEDLTGWLVLAGQTDRRMAAAIVESRRGDVYPPAEAKRVAAEQLGLSPDWFARRRRVVEKNAALSGSKP